MPLKPLDMQVVLGQSDYAGQIYSKNYMQQAKTQLYYEALYQNKSKKIDESVTSIDQEAEESQQTYFDPHDQHNHSYKPFNSKIQKRLTQKDTLIKDPFKGHIIDILT